MGLYDYQKEALQKLRVKSTPVDPVIIRKYREDMEKNAKLYQKESAIRIAKTTRLAKQTVVV